MNNPLLGNALELYKSRLIALEASAPHPSTEQILDVLVARDHIQTALAERGPDCTADLVILKELDSRLKQQALINQINLKDWCTLLNPKAEAWWWFLQPLSSQESQHDWLWSALSVSFLTISLGLVTNIAPRFLSGGPDILGAVTVMGQSVLTLLAVGGVLTKAGREAIERILTRLKLPKQSWQAMSCGFSLLLLLGLVSFRLSLPQIAGIYNQRGLDSYKNGQWSSALSSYLRALQLNPDYAEAHFNLGVLYEDLQDFDKARTEYRIALQAEDGRAYNNLARLYILDKKYALAIPLLIQGQKLAKDQESKYALLKNLGWVRLEQSRYAAAESYLREAVELMDARAPAHCLLAQTLEKQKNRKESLHEWESCLRHASSSRPDEDAWIDQAKKRLKAKGTK